MDPIYSYMVHSVGPSLGSQIAWCSTPQGKIILVHCRHPWSHHPGSTLKWETSSCEDEPCHHCQTTQHTSCTCFHYSSHNHACYSPEAAKPIRSTDDLIKEFPDWFQGIGLFPSEYKIQLHHDAHPVIHGPQEMPHCLTSKGQRAPQQDGMPRWITHVDEPMDWVSSITYIQKANGELHLCLNPHDLNEAIHWDHHKMPTVEEVAHEFAHSHFFTKLDAHHGYWSIILD